MSVLTYVGLALKEALENKKWSRLQPYRFSASKRRTALDPISKLLDRLFFQEPLSFSYTISATRLPLNSIAPKVGPIRGSPKAVETAIPATASPG